MPTKINDPGVYVKEVAGPLLINGVATSVTAFLGAAERGPVNKPSRIPSIAAFEQSFGNLAHGLELGYAVSQFFINGGSDAYVVRIARQPTLAGIRKALSALDRVDLINLIAMPGLARREWLEVALDYCAQRRAFFIADSPSDCSTPAAMLEQVNRDALPVSPNGAIFFPWIKIPDPVANKRLRLCAPSGSIAGLFARMDRQHGVWKSPVGKEAYLAGVTGLACRITDNENDQLNRRAINCLRAFPESGVVAWGARTLAGDEHQSSDWKYVPIRRLALFIEESILRGTQWAVFEPNDEPLWAKLRLSVSAFLYDLWREGASQGGTPNQAYFVKCDRTTMTQNDIDEGKLNIVVGVATVRPAEFVIIRIGQWMKGKPYPT